MSSRLPTYFVSHGGGPWPFMRETYGSTYDVLATSLGDIRRELGDAPKAILVVSSHWEEDDFMVSSGAQPAMIYDYGGFPAHTYQVKYPAPGHPELAERVAGLLNGAGHQATLDPTRGFDPLTHIKAGRALAPLRDEGVVIIGSGLSYHNLRQFGPAGRVASHDFDGWLQHTLLALPPAEREAALLHWDSAPSARMAHPREEHLVPLMVALGAAEQEAAACVYHEDEFFGHLAVSSFRFGVPPA